MTITDWIQAISMLILVAVTGIYAWRTHVISKGTEKQADASVQMAEEMREQRYEAVRPVIDIQWHAPDDARRLGELVSSPAQLASKGCSCVLRNVGLGPAIDTYSFVRSPSGERQVYDFGTLPVEREAPSINSLPTSFPTVLSPKQERERVVIEIYYGDVYGRRLVSGREIVGKQGDWKLGPLKIRLVEEGGKND